MPEIPNNLCAPLYATGGNMQLTAAPSPRGTNEQTKPKKRANIRIATLNMNGASAPTQRMNHIDKWSTIHSTVRNEHIAILALQETHLDDDRLNDINRCFGRNFEITNTGMPGNPRTTAGVAIILNKAMIAPTSVKTYVLKQGRALAMRIKWADAGDLTILNIYAPNERRQHPTFWAKLEEERIDQRMPKPDLILGDFNVTEDGIDRSPPQENERAATDALRNIRLSWGVQDQWRHDNPSERLFTHKHLNNGKHEYARLNRIYSKRTRQQAF